MCAQEISALLGSKLTDEDEDEVLQELAAIEQDESITVHDQVLPHRPTLVACASLDTLAGHVSAAGQGSGSARHAAAEGG